MLFLWPFRIPMPNTMFLSVSGYCYRSILFYFVPLSVCGSFSSCLCICLLKFYLNICFGCAMIKLSRCSLQLLLFLLILSISYTTKSIMQMLQIGFYYKFTNNKTCSQPTELVSLPVFTIELIPIFPIQSFLTLLSVSNIIVAIIIRAEKAE